MIAAVPDGFLQDKGHRPYFQEALALQPGKICVSQLELHEEHGRLSIPHTPVMRVAIPIYLSDERPEAIVVIRNDVAPLLSGFERELGARYKLYLFDSQGRFLLHPDPRHRFGPQAGSLARVADEFPHLTSHLSDSVSEQVIEHAPTGRTVVANLRRLYRDSDPNNDRRLLLTRELSDITAGQGAMKAQMIVWGGALLTIALGTAAVFSRSITRPLRQITLAVERFGEGEEQLDLPLNARDEAGVLARSFDTMSRKTREHDAQMKKEVHERRNAEKALRAAERQLRLALDAAQAGVWAWNLKDDSHYQDEAAQEIFGLRIGQNGNLSWTDRLHPANRYRIEEELQMARLRSLPFESDFRIAGHKRTNDELEQFVYSVSHDLKSPLVTCNG